MAGNDIARDVGWEQDWSKDRRQVRESIAHCTRWGETTLLLYNEGLLHVPGSISRLSHLRSLFLGANQLSSLPEGIINLKNLQVLALGRNKFQKFPAAVCALHRLEELLLFDNQLSSLPPSIAALASLRKLHVQRNALSALPATLHALTSLSDLDLHANALRTLPPSLCLLSPLLTDDQGRRGALVSLSIYDNPLDAALLDCSSSSDILHVLSSRMQDHHSILFPASPLPAPFTLPDQEPYLQPSRSQSPPPASLSRSFPPIHSSSPPTHPPARRPLSLDASPPAIGREGEREGGREGSPDKGRLQWSFYAGVDHLRSLAAAQEVLKQSLVSLHTESLLRQHAERTVEALQGSAGGGGGGAREVAAVAIKLQQLQLQLEREQSVRENLESKVLRREIEQEEAVRLAYEQGQLDLVRRQQQEAAAAARSAPIIRPLVDPPPELQAKRRLHRTPPAAASPSPPPIYGNSGADSPSDGRRDSGGWSPKGREHGRNGGGRSSRNSWDGGGRERERERETERERDSPLGWGRESPAGRRSSMRRGSRGSVSNGRGSQMEEEWGGRGLGEVLPPKGGVRRPAPNNYTAIFR